MYEISGNSAQIVAFEETRGEVMIPLELNGVKVSYALENEWETPRGDALTLGPGIQTIPDKMFSNMPAQSVSLPDSMVEIGEGAFAWCYNLREIVIPEGVTKIGAQAFRYCDNLQRIVLPSTVTEIGDEAFSGCHGLYAFEVHPDNPKFTAIDGALYSKDGKTLYTYPEGRGRDYAMPDGTLFIKPWAFLGNYSLSSLSIPEGVTELPELLLASCESLLEIRLPSTLEAIAEDALPGGRTLQTIAVAGNAGRYYIADDALLDRATGTLLFHNKTQETHYTVPAGAQRIGKGAFAGDTSLQSVAIPSGVIAIERGVFSRCTSLTQVALPITLASIGDYAFSDCIALERISLPPGLVEIGEGAFFNCASLRQIRIPESVTSVGEYAFEDVPNLTILGGEGKVSPRATPMPAGEAFEIPGLLYDVQDVAMAYSEEANVLLPVYDRPSASGALVGEYHSGTTMLVLSRESGWSRVRVDGVEGYAENLRLAFHPVPYPYTPGFGMVKDGKEMATFTAPWDNAPGGGMLQSNTWYAITQTVGCWYEIDLGGLERGYVLSQYIQVQRADASDTRAFGVVANPSYFDRLHLREKPSTSGKSLARFYNGARLEILGDEGDWYRVRVGNLEGYMMKKFVDVVQ